MSPWSTDASHYGTPILIRNYNNLPSDNGGFGIRLGLQNTPMGFDDGMNGSLRPVHKTRDADQPEGLRRRKTGVDEESINRAKNAQRAEPESPASFPSTEAESD